MKKVVFGITSLTLGGAERVLIDIANKLSNEYDITIFTVYSNGELENQLNENVKRISIYSKSRNEFTKLQKMWIPLKLLLFKKHIYNKYLKNKYDVEISFLEGVITRIFSTKIGNVQQKIAWVHNDISKVFGTGVKAKLKRKIDENIYNKYNKIIFVSNENLENFKSTYPNISSENLYVIYNYINPELVIEKSKQDMEKVQFDENVFNIVTVARLVEQKAIDRLINVHTKLIREGMNHNIYVIGDGTEREKLEQLVKDNKVEKSFKLLGKRENPYPYIKNADCFALLSYYEGYPMVLLEAQILEKYIVITNTAARETIRDYEDSRILENNEEEIYKGLKDLIKDKENLKNKNKKKYSNSDIIEKIIKVIEE